MKKVIVFLIACTVAVMLCACGKTAKQTNQSKDPAKTLQNASSGEQQSGASKGDAANAANGNVGKDSKGNAANNSANAAGRGKDTSKGSQNAPVEKKQPNTSKNNSGDAGKGQKDSDSSTLIVYYSYSGTTQKVAEHLQKLTGGTLYKLTLVEPYSGGSNAVSDRVFAERDAGKMPNLQGTMPDISQYDRVLIGTPVWNASMANPVLGYLQQTDFGGKTVAPFWTYVTDQGTTEKDFKSNAKNARMAGGLPLRSAGSMTDTKLDQTLQAWLRKVGTGKNATK